MTDTIRAHKRRLQTEQRVLRIAITIALVMLLGVLGGLVLFIWLLIQCGLL